MKIVNMKKVQVWIPRKVNYDFQEGKLVLPTQNIKFSDYHPLKPIMVTESLGVRAMSGKRRQSDTSSTKSSASSLEAVEFVDPLSALGGTDPLTEPLTSYSSLKEESKSKDSANLERSEEYGDDFEHWSARKNKILSKYTTDEKLSMEMISLVKGGDRGPSRPVSSINLMSEKFRSRLSQLEDLAEGSVKEIKVQRQQDFISTMRGCRQGLQTTWNANQKVNALKIAIQCSKMLSDSSVMLFYPSKFVLVADILDTFGSLVYERILSLCGGMSEKNIVPEEVPQAARDICTNWMLKIASIRELLPRILIEACILPCYNFIKKDGCNSVLVRLTSMTRGVGNPLMAVYVRTYLCMVGVKHTPKFKGHLASNFYDFVSTYKQIHTTSVQNEMAHQKIDMPTYLSLFTPALEWILSCVANKAHESTLKDLLERCVKTGSSLLLQQCLLASFKPDYVSAHAMELCNTISESQDTLFPKATVYQTLGTNLCTSDPPDEDKLPLLNKVWKFVIKIQDPADYIECAEVWSEYAVKNFKKREVNTVLGDIIKHMVPDRAFEKHYGKLQSVVRKILTHMTDFSIVFSMDNFLPFLDMFQKEDVKVDTCKVAADFFIKGTTSTSDPLVIDGMMYICKAMHSSINSMSSEGEQKAISDVICGVVRRVSFGRDFEQQLSFYVECRASFHNLDQVLATLIHLVNTLSAKASKIVRRNHTSKTAAFVRACSAYCFITIPSLSNVYLRLSLYLSSGQASLISHCITQADAMFCAAISQILDMPMYISSQDGKSMSSQNTMVAYISNFLSTLLSVPDHPEQGMLYLLRGLVNVVSGVGMTSSIFTLESRITIYIRVLSLLTAYSQDKYLYHVDNVDSNENLYSNDKKFLEEISSIGAALLDEIFSFLSSNAEEDQVKISTIALDFYSTIMAHGNMEDSRLQELATSVGSIVKSGQTNLKLKAKIQDSMKRKGGVYAKVVEDL